MAADGVGIASHRPHALGVGNAHGVVTRRGDDGLAGRGELPDTVGLAGNEVDRAEARRSERRAEGAVAHRVLLGVVPHRGDGVAVVVVHGQPLATVGRCLAGVAAGELHELVHRSGVVCLLLCLVAVVLVARRGLGGRQAGRLYRVGIVRREQVVVLEGRDVARCVLCSLEARRGDARALLLLAGDVGGVRVGREVVVEGHVLPEDHDDVLDGRGRRRVPVAAGRGGICADGTGAERTHGKCCGSGAGKGESSRADHGLSSGGGGGRSVPDLPASRDRTAVRPDIGLAARVGLEFPEVSPTRRQAPIQLVQPQRVGPSRPRTGVRERRHDKQRPAGPGEWARR